MCMLCSVHHGNVHTCSQTAGLQTENTLWTREFLLEFRNSIVFLLKQNRNVWIWFSKHPFVLNDFSDQCGIEFLMEAHSSPDAFIYYFLLSDTLHEVRCCGRKVIEAFNQPDILQRRELTSARNEWIQGLVSLTAGSGKYPQSSLFPRSALFAKLIDYLRCKVSERLCHADGSETSRRSCSSASIPSWVVFVIFRLPAVKW